MSHLSSHVNALKKPNLQPTMLVISCQQLAHTLFGPTPHQKALHSTLRLWSTPTRLSGCHVVRNTKMSSSVVRWRQIQCGDCNTVTMERERVKQENRQTASLQDTAVHAQDECVKMERSPGVARQQVELQCFRPVHIVVIVVAQVE